MAITTTAMVFEEVALADVVIMIHPETRSRRGYF
jgi:hypothetical protein